MRTNRSIIRASASALAAVSVLALGACGSSQDSSGQPPIKLSAATSLKKPLTALAAAYAPAKLQLEFAGSDKIAAQLSGGRRPTVVVLAGKDIPVQLKQAGLIDNPVPIAANRLVVAYRTGSKPITSLEDLGKPGVKVALGSSTVPVGKYVDRVLALLPPKVKAAILANTKTREPDASGVVGKLLEGAVDAAIVYRTDVLAAKGTLTSAFIPSALKPTVTYWASTVSGAPGHEAGAQLVRSLTDGQGRAVLAAGGFLPPPKN